MNQWEVLEILEREGAVQKGHFLLSSGLHSDTYVQCAKVLQYPHLAESLADEIAREAEGLHPDLVISPAMGGIIIGYMVALAMHTRMVFAERQEDRMTLRRGQQVHEGERAVIVEDVITTGASVQEIAQLVMEHGGTVVGLGAIIERGEDRDFGVPKKVLLRLDAPVWEAGECPLCVQGAQLEIPGSRRSG